MEMVIWINCTIQVWIPQENFCPSDHTGSQNQRKQEKKSLNSHSCEFSETKSQVCASVATNIRPLVFSILCMSRIKKKPAKVEQQGICSVAQTGMVPQTKE